MMAQAMVDSAFTAPHVTEWITVDATATMELVERLRSDREFKDVKVTPLLVLAKAMCVAIRRNPDFALDIIAKVIERARESTENVKNLALLDVYGRVARLLLNLAVETDGKLRIPEKITQQEIAERVGASRDMVSRIFRDLTVGGYITVENRFVTINKKPPARW